MSRTINVGKVVGNGIQNIVKTSETPIQKEYRINYTDGGHFDYIVENGEVTQAQLDETNRAIDYYKSTLNALPKVEGEGTSLTLDDTAEAPMKMSLGPSELEQAILPDTYQQVDYIASSGTQYIKLNYIANQDTNCKGEYQLINDSTGAFIFGSRYASGNRAYGLNFGGSAPLRYYNNFGNSNITTKETDLNVHTFEKNGEKLYIDNTLINTLSTNTFTTPNEMIVFGCDTNGTIGLFASVKIFNLKFYTNNVLSVDLIPCYRKSDNVIGLYDLVNGVFYTNQGTGDFAKGNNVPNPDYPQDIHTISGDNEIYIQTKNIFDGEIELGSLSTTTGENQTNINKVRSKNYIKVKPSTQYKIAKNGVGISINYMMYDKNKNYLSYNTAAFNTYMTTNNKCYYIRWFTYNNDTDLTAVYQINEGTTIQPYTPHQQQLLPLNLGDLEYCKIGDYEDEFVIPKNNLLSVPFSNSSANNLRATLDNFKVGNYIFSFNITSTSNQYQVTAKKLVNGITTIINTIYNTPKLSFNLDEDATLILDIYRIGILPEQVSNIMLNSGTIELPYEPYNDGKWYLKKNIGNAILNGSEDWTLFNTSSVRNVFKVRIIGIESYSNGSSKPRLLATRFISKSYNATWKIGDISRLTDVDNQNVIVLVYEPSSSVEAFKSWLSTHNTIVDYVLATPEYILLNDTLQSQLTEIYKWVKAYQDQTNISQVNNDLPFVIKVSAVRDMSKIFELIGGGE